MSSWANKFKGLADQAGGGAGSDDENNEPAFLRSVYRFQIGNIATFGLSQEEAVSCYHKIKILNTDQPTRYILYLPEEQLAAMRGASAPQEENWDDDMFDTGDGEETSGGTLQ